MLPLRKEILLLSLIFCSSLLVSPAMGESDCEVNPNTSVQIKPEKFADLGKKIVMGGRIKSNRSPRLSLDNSDCLFYPGSRGRVSPGIFAALGRRLIFGRPFGAISQPYIKKDDECEFNSKSRRQIRPGEFASLGRELAFGNENITVKGLKTGPGKSDCLYYPKPGEKEKSDKQGALERNPNSEPEIVLVTTRIVGKGQCSLCHTFEEGIDYGRGPNLFGIEERSHQRIKEARYKTHPFPAGRQDPLTGIVKGAKTGEEYIRESMICPDCFIVDGYGKENDLKNSSCPVANKPPLFLSEMEINAIIAYLQSYATPGDYSKVTVELPFIEDMP